MIFFKSVAAHKKSVIPRVPNGEFKISPMYILPSPPRLDDCRENLFLRWQCKCSICLKYDPVPVPVPFSSNVTWIYHEFVLKLPTRRISYGSRSVYGATEVNLPFQFLMRVVLQRIEFSMLCFVCLCTVVCMFDLWYFIWILIHYLQNTCPKKFFTKACGCLTTKKQC